MLKIIENLPEHVLGLTADGEVTGDEYENVLMPAIEGKFMHVAKLSILFQLMPGFTMFTIPAAIDDMKIGFKYFSQWGRVAIVSDHHVINGYTKLISNILPIEINVFGNDE